MATWIVKHAISGETVAEHSTKKDAAADAKARTEQAEAIDAKHLGAPVSFQVEKQEGD